MTPPGPAPGPAPDTAARERPAPIPADRLRVPMPPRHATVADERRHRRERLAGALRVFARYGYDEGVSGHITVRDPEFTDCFWVNPFGLPFTHVTAGELVLVDGDGQVLEGRHHVNQAAFVLHSEVHRARPDVAAVAHSHSQHGRALAALGKPLAPLTQDACAFYEDHAVYEPYTGVVVDPEQARRVAEALGGRKALVLRHHGLLTVGGSVDAAAWWFHQMERCAGVQLAAEAAGAPVPIGHEDALATREQLGGDLVGWINYQPLWETVTREDPGLLG